ncbi:MAG: ABC transporter ATP-binding protein [Bacteroidetes bacterium]|nr:MAG: ABC transporter ATP-binding protein [Bacteroidota bacterium]
MSKALIEALIKLFAIIAKEDDITVDERDKVKLILRNVLNDDLVEEYMHMFDEVADNLMSESRDETDEELIASLSKSLNTELTRHQKIAALVQLTAIMMADGIISDREAELIELIRENFNVDNAEQASINLFVRGRSPGQLNNQNILIIDGNDYGDSNKFHHIKREHIDGYIGLIHIPQSNSYFIKNMGRNAVYVNGIALPENHIKPFSSGSAIRGKFETIYYTDIISQFQSENQFQILSLEVDHIGYTFKNGHIGLRNIHFSENSGKLMGIMGASGAGKSTLLNILNGSDKPSEGKVLLNGVDIHHNPEFIEGVIGFVPQDDLLFDQLTVYQNLYYAAKLCFSNFSEEEIDSLVNKTLTNIGLLEIKDLQVGSPLEKVISGGQRKRVNIALELLREPSILYVDEPTSGLSSRDSENIMDLLKDLSLNGKIVFVVIHQPSSVIFKMFDKLLVLDTGGYQIFYGDPVESIIYFREVAKLLESDQGECAHCGNVNPEQVFDIIETRVVDEYGNITTDRKVTPEQWNRYYETNLKQIPITVSEEKPESSLRIPSKWKQTKIFVLRDALAKLTNRQYVLINLLEAPVLAVILAVFVRYSPTIEYIFQKNQNIPSYLFMSIIVALFMGLTVSAEEIIKDKKILKREAFLNLSKNSYFTSKLITQFAISAIQTFLFVLIGNSILGIHGMFFTFWAILFTTAAFANLLGLNISSAMNSVVTVYILIPFLLIPQLLLSGVVVKFDQLNKLIRNDIEVPIVGDFMVSRWALEAALVDQFINNDFEKNFYAVDEQIAENRYTLVYLLPTIEKILNEGFKLSGNESTHEQAKEKLATVSYEINNLLAIVGKDQLPEVDQINISEINKEVVDKTIIFLKVYKTYAQKRQEGAVGKKDAITSKMVEQGIYEPLKNKYSNDVIAQTVMNNMSTVRIVEKGGKLHRLSDPIFYSKHQSSNLLDYRTPLYVPVKSMMGVSMNTTYFNIMLIWVMSIIMILALYNNWLRKLFNLFEKAP